MATSPIYNWPEPDNTDLVKNGALAIRTLGNAIDTTMATMTPKSLVDAKGDLIAASAADTPARLAVGNNGETLVADSSTSTGLRYQGNFAAGKSKIINGDFSTWQRGTTFTHSGAAYTADRFQGYSDASQTYTRQAFTAGTAPVAGYEGQYFWRGTKSASGGFISIIQKIEDVRTLANQTMTVSFWAKTDAAQTIYVRPYQHFGSGGSSSVVFSALSATTTTSWARYSFTFAVPSISGKTMGTSSFLAFEAFIAPASTVVMDIWGVQVEAGSVATAFQTATGTIQGELAACQRYYYLHASGAYLSIGNAGYYSASQVNGMVQFPVSMRIAPSLVATTGAGYYIADRNGGSNSLNSFTIYRPTATTAMLYNGSEATGTAGHAALLYTNNASSSIAFSAEL